MSKPANADVRSLWASWYEPVTTAGYCPTGVQRLAVTLVTVVGGSLMAGNHLRTHMLSEDFKKQVKHSRLIKPSEIKQVDGVFRLH